MPDEARDGRNVALKFLSDCWHAWSSKEEFLHQNFSMPNIFHDTLQRPLTCYNPWGWAGLRGRLCRAQSGSWSCSNQQGDTLYEDFLHCLLAAPSVKWTHGQVRQIHRHTCPPTHVRAHTHKPVQIHTHQHTPQIVCSRYSGYRHMS